MSLFRSLMAQRRTSNTNKNYGGYISDGLIFMIDAIWNDAVNKPQNQELGGLRDLVSGELLRFPSGYENKYQWHDDRLTIFSGNADTSHKISFDTGLKISDLEGMTVEQADAALRWALTDNYNNVQASVSNTAFMFMSRRPPGTVVEHDAIRTFYFYTSSVIYGSYLHTPSVLNKLRHISCTLSPVIASASSQTFPTNVGSMRLNGEPITSLVSPYNVRATITPSSALYVYVGNNQRMDMDFRTYRIYNRPLSVSEQEHNYAIDKLRFSI